MSKIANAIAAAQGHDIRASLGTVSVESGFNTDAYLPLSRDTKYHLGVTLGMDMWIPNDVAGAAHHAVETTRRYVVEEVFGEFRLPLLELERAIWDQDRHRAFELLRQIREQMFSTIGGQDG